MGNGPLVEALRKAENEKNAAVPPEEAVEHTFSDRFQKKMTFLIRVQHQPGWDMMKTPARRSLFLLLILLLTFGVRPDRNPLFRFAQPVPQLTVTRLPAAEPAALLPQPENASSSASGSPYTAPEEKKRREELPREASFAGLSEPTGVPAVSRSAPDTAGPSPVSAVRESAPAAEPFRAVESGTAPAPEVTAALSETASKTPVSDGQPVSAAPSPVTEPPEPPEPPAGSTLPAGGAAPAEDPQPDSRPSDPPRGQEDTPPSDPGSFVMPNEELSAWLNEMSEAPKQTNGADENETIDLYSDRQVISPEVRFYE